MYMFALFAEEGHKKWLKVSETVRKLYLGLGRFSQSCSKVNCPQQQVKPMWTEMQDILSPNQFFFSNSVNRIAFLLICCILILPRHQTLGA